MKFCLGVQLIVHLFAKIVCLKKLDVYIIIAVVQTFILSVSACACDIATLPKYLYPGTKLNKFILFQFIW